MPSHSNSRRRFPWFEVVVLVGLAIIFALTYSQYKTAQRDLLRHQQEISPSRPAK